MLRTTLGTYFALMIFVCPVSSMAQGTDSASAEDRFIDFRERPALFLMYDRSYSFVDSKLASTTGIIGGLDFSRKLKIGLGYSWLVSDVVEEKVIITEAGTDSSLNAKLSLHSGVIYGEYIFLKKGNWELSSTLNMAIGSSYFTYYEDVGDQIKEKKLNQEGVWIVSGTAMATYRFLKWFGLSSGIGLRVVPIDNSKMDHNLNGPIFTFKFRIFFGEIYKSVFPNGLSKKTNDG